MSSTIPRMRRLRPSNNRSCVDFTDSRSSTVLLAHVHAPKTKRHCSTAKTETDVSTAVRSHKALLLSFLLRWQQRNPGLPDSSAFCRAQLHQQTKGAKVEEGIFWPQREFTQLQAPSLIHRRLSHYCHPLPLLASLTLPQWSLDIPAALPPPRSKTQHSFLILRDRGLKQLTFAWQEGRSVPIASLCALRGAVGSLAACWMLLPNAGNRAALLLRRERKKRWWARAATVCTELPGRARDGISGC